MYLFCISQKQKQISYISAYNQTLVVTDHESHSSGSIHSQLSLFAQKLLEMKRET